MSMTRRAPGRRRSIVSALLASAAALVLVGCSAASSIAFETVSGVPAGVTLTDDEQMGEQPVAVWTDSRETLTVVTWGSSSCPPVPTSLVLASDMLLNLTFAAPTDQACTADYAPTSHVFSTPDGVSASVVQLAMVFEARSGGSPGEVTVPIRENE